MEPSGKQQRYSDNMNRGGFPPDQGKEASTANPGKGNIAPCAFN